ncbi:MULTISPECIES: transposase family protein [Streptomyces]|uniref:transposase family protein n=1 Tax=Streptomyces TaxID=1883 RepID=UPI000A4522BD|nr:MULTISPECIES: transposase family protein [Streptomyces]
MHLPVKASGLVTRHESLAVAERPASTSIASCVQRWSTGTFSRISCSRGISRQHLGCLVEELAGPWQAVVEGHRHEARGGAGKCEAGAGARQRPVFVDRLAATLIHLRLDLPHAVLGLLFGVDRSTITRAIGEMRGLLAERGCAVPGRPGLWLGALADVFAADHPGVRKVWVDGGYRQHLVEHATTIGIDMEITARKPGTRGFTPIPQRWAVERTYGWLMLNRRLARDCETLPTRSAVHQRVHCPAGHIGIRPSELPHISPRAFVGKG